MIELTKSKYYELVKLKEDLSKSEKTELIEVSKSLGKILEGLPEIEKPCMLLRKYPNALNA